jgi:hypothetical protein
MPSTWAAVMVSMVRAAAAASATATAAATAAAAAAAAASLGFTGGRLLPPPGAAP